MSKPNRLRWLKKLTVATIVCTIKHLIDWLICLITQQ